MLISISTTIHRSDLSGETNTCTTTDIVVASVDTESNQCADEPGKRWSKRLHEGSCIGYDMGYIV
jgi:hypothetical protein